MLHLMGADLHGDPDDPRFLAIVDLIRRTGAISFSMRTQEDEAPTVWIAVAEHNVNADGIPVAADQPGRQHWQTGAALSPLEAALRLADQLVDGGRCVHCQRPTGVSEDWEGRMPLDRLVCWYRFDPELATFRRSCEGVSP